jgi:hypothetical protein
MMEQMDLFAAKPLKYVRGSETSLEAAIAAEPRAGTQRRRVLDLLREYPVTGLADHEMQNLLGMNPSTQRPRRIELVEAGLVKDSGRHRLTDSGKRAVVWVAA